jgi:Flp pilus assembly protein TadD
MKAAVDALRQALAIKPDYERARYGLGIALKRLGDDRAAASEMTSVARAHAERARLAEARKALLDGERAGSIVEAEQAYLHALELQPGYARAQMALGILYARAGDLQKAQQLLHDATLSDPDSADSHYNYALVLGRAGESELLEAIALQPDHIEARMQLGLLLMNRGDLAGAAKNYEEVLRKQPDSAEASNNLGLVWLRSNDAAQAKQALEKAVRLKPDYAAAHYNLALALEQLGEVHAAQAEFAEASRLDPSIKR